MFSGRSLPPQRMQDETAMLEKIGTDPNAIGWLADLPKRKGLRVVLTLKEQP
jgi:hypothetical protein